MREGVLTIKSDDMNENYKKWGNLRKDIEELDASLASVAKSGIYEDLENKPVVPTLLVNTQNTLAMPAGIYMNNFKSNTGNTVTTATPVVAFVSPSTSVLRHTVAPTWANLAVSFPETPTHTAFPSVKCVADALALKADANVVEGKEDVSNKVTALSSDSTDTQYPSAKCVYDLVGNVESLLASI